MQRRQTKLSRTRSRTMWLAWCAWGVIGSIFLFEDTQGGTGWLTLILTAPFWCLFVLWPFLWGWLKFRKDPALVDFDEDIEAGDVKARLVIYRGVKYVEKEAFSCARALEGVKIPGGDEAFVTLEAVRDLACDEQKTQVWIAAAAAIAVQ